MSAIQTKQHIGRRDWLTRALLFGVSLCLQPLLALAKKPEALEAIQKIIGSNALNEGKVKLVLPPLIENGNLVVLKVGVDNPMTEQNYVKAIHIIAEGNPLPNVFSAYLTPRSGAANITTRVRLAESQKVWAIAQLSDGSFWQSSVQTMVTTSACTEEP